VVALPQIGDLAAGRGCGLADLGVAVPVVEVHAGQISLWGVLLA
jgi:hypothetical protein